jgi:CheY-like chemotaxis protein
MVTDRTKSRASVSSIPPPYRHDDVTLAAAVHELQNVLASVHGWVQLAREHSDPELMARALMVVDRGVTRASEMVGALTDPDAALRARDTVFDVRVALAETYDLLDARCRAQSVALRSLHGASDTVLLARGDPSRMMQIVTNLVLNATKAVAAYRAAHTGLVELSALEGDGGVVITVRDNGPGMSSATLARAFEPFFSTAAPGEGPVGTGRGLGMAVSRSLAEAMGARLELHSEEGVGTEATLTLRRAARTSQPSRPSTPPMADDTRLPSGLRVLVVDDEPTIRELLEVALALRGARVVTVSDLRAARKALARGDAEVALVDEGLGNDQSGAAFLAEMSVLWPGVGRVLMTGASSLDNEREVPCAAFVRKPFLLDDVVRALVLAARER